MMAAAECVLSPMTAPATTGKQSSKANRTTRHHTNWKTGGLLLCAAALLFCPGCVLFSFCAGYSVNTRHERPVDFSNTIDTTPITKAYLDKTGSRLMVQYFVTYEDSTKQCERWLCIDAQHLNDWVLRKQKQPRDPLIDEIKAQDGYWAVTLKHHASERFIYSSPRWNRSSMSPALFVLPENESTLKRGRDLLIRHTSRKSNNYVWHSLVYITDLPATPGLDRIEIQIPMRSSLTGKDKAIVTGAALADLATWPVQLVGIGGIALVECIRDATHHDTPSNPTESTKDAPSPSVTPDRIPESKPADLSTLNEQQTPTEQPQANPAASQ